MPFPIDGSDASSSPTPGVPPETLPGPLQWLKKFAHFVLTHPYTVVTFITLLVMFIIAVVRKQSEWDQTYIGASRALLQGKDIFNDVKTNTYPPFSSWFFLPYALLPIRLARGIWFIVNAVSFIVLVKLSWRLAGGRNLEPTSDSPPAAPREQIAFLLGHACALQLALNGLTHLQTDLPIAALLMIGCAAIAAGRFMHAAGWIGVAAAFKATPLLFAPYLLWRGKWRAALLLGAVAVGANLLPNTVHSPPGGGIWLVRWYQHYVQPMTKANYVPGDWKNMLNNNQALSGAASRWITSSWREDSEDLRTVNRPGYAPQWLLKNVREAHPEWDADHVGREAGRKSVRAVFMILCASVLLPVAWVMWLAWKNRRQWGMRESTHAGTRLPNVHMLECGIVLALMLLLSPNSSRAHFCVLYLPAFCVARLAVRPGASMLLRVLLALAVVSATLSIHIRLPFTMTFEQILLWLGVVMFATIFLLLASAVALAAGHRPTVQAQTYQFS